MKCLLFILFLYIYCVCSSCSSTNSPQIFKFGTNVGRLDFFDSGYISVFQKTTTIPIIVQPCRKLTYVEVAIYNNYSTPTVSLNFDTLSVSIKYKLFHISTSRYEIMAKSIPDSFCKNQQGNN